MKVYNCKNCQQPLYFENSYCISCQHPVGFDADQLSMITLEKTEPAAAMTPPGNVTGAAAAGNSKEPAPVAAGAPKNVGIITQPAPKNEVGATQATAPENETGIVFADITDKTRLYKFCQNAAFGTCNWLIPATQASPFCLACQLNRIIPPLSNPQMLDRWKRIEVAKHRLVYSLLRLNLPVGPKASKEDSAGIAFDFMADLPGDQRILTGHDKGVITLNIEEADDAERTRNKLDLGEKYRTLLGHFRHEIGHYYWDQLISNNPSIEGYRLIFGDERPDYGEALKTYYQNGAPANWPENFISPYASSHPWEDWAETWAHYMHLMDTLETAYAFGISIHPRKTEVMEADISRDPYAVKNFDQIIKMWLPLTFAVNSLNRSMGHADFYPFVISTVIIEKLRFIHERVKTQGAVRKAA